jgi:hypothetical protein
MFRALLAHLQEAVHKRHLVYCVRILSVGCTRIGVELAWKLLAGTGAENAHLYYDIVKVAVIGDEHCV